MNVLFYFKTEFTLDYLYANMLFSEQASSLSISVFFIRTKEIMHSPPIPF